MFLPGESHEPRSLTDYGPLGCKQSDMTEGTQHACTGNTGSQIKIAWERAAPPYGNFCPQEKEGKLSHGPQEECVRGGALGPKVLCGLVSSWSSLTALVLGMVSQQSCFCVRKLLLDKLEVIMGEYPAVF